ncbi:hypothetical protein [Gluconobacter sp. DsW_058]|uniref:hypothetical protein n=1 Tax=Gluconobacter sp. DsW_058 TaxID=1511210 RepID=UPI000A391BFF|nr:hypothetical protein [Gluconobacter sp. DsW_058]OUJ09288.1 hypothetical protein HK24_00560 [Gluconobacter sp. DsW_058]
MPDTQTSAPSLNVPSSKDEVIRVLEDRVLKLETLVSALGDNQSDLRAEMRSEIASLRTQISDLKEDLEDGIKALGSKVDRVMGGKAVVTAVVTLATSILGSGVVHLVVSVGR